MVDIVLNSISKELNGVGVIFTEITLQDTDFVLKIRSDKTLNALSANNIDRDIHIEWFNRYKERENDIYWIVRHKKSLKPIGTAALYDIDLKSRKAESGRTIIIPEYREYVFDVFLTRMKFAFEKLNLNKVYAKVRESSKDILNLDVKLGFNIDGLLREDWWNGSEYVNLYLISLLRSDYSNYKKTRYKKYLNILKNIESKR